MSKLTVVVPAYNEGQGLLVFHERLSTVLDNLDMESEVLYIDDGSSDDTFSVMQGLSEQDSRVALLRLSRNFGKELALTAGLDHVSTSADAVIIIDADLQDPPELIVTFMQHWLEGYDVVYGTRASRDGETRLKKLTAAAFYQIMEKVSNIPLPRDTGDFRLLSRRALDALSGMRERQRFMKGLFTWVGYRQKAVVYHRDPRFSGESKFNYWRLWNFALEGITSFSSAPLKLATYVGLITAIVSLGFGFWVFAKALLWGDPVRGYPSLMVVMLFLGSIQLIALGMIGEYLSRIYVETKQRPLYLIDEYQPAKNRSV